MITDWWYGGDRNFGGGSRLLPLFDRRIFVPFNNRERRGKVAGINGDEIRLLVWNRYWKNTSHLSTVERQVLFIGCKRPSEIVLWQFKLWFRKIFLKVSYRSDIRPTAPQVLINIFPETWHFGIIIRTQNSILGFPVFRLDQVLNF